MASAQQQKNKQNNSDGVGSSGDEPQRSGQSQSVHCTEEPQTPFTLLQPCNNNNSTIESLYHSAATVVTDVTTSRLEQPQRDGCDSCSSSTDRARNELGITERTQWGPSLTIPDIDDTSVNYTFLYMEHYKVDLLWSMLSDSFFILGGISYIVLSGWDYYTYKNNIANGIPVDDTTNQWYIVVDLIAPTVYLLNSIIDIHWAEAARQRILNKQDMTKIWDESRFQLRGISFTSSSLSTTFDYSNETEVQNCFGCTWCYRMRKYAAHRRTMMAAVSFGIAASLAVLAAILRNFFLPTFQSEYGTIHEISPWVYSVDSILDALSDHVYIVSAIFSMTGKRHRPWLAPSDPNTILFNDSERLEDLGDLLFLMGSLVDATLSDLQLMHLVLLPILSSILWMVDGFLYMRSDIVKAHKIRDEAIVSQNDTHPIKFIV